MNTKLLLPNKFKPTGWILLTVGIIGTIWEPSFPWLSTNVFGIITSNLGRSLDLFKVTSDNLSNELFWSLTIIGGLLVAFSKEKIEDEFIANLRLSSFMWAVFINYVVLLFTVLFVYGPSFISVMLTNMFTVLIIFIIRFNYVLYKASRKLANEKYN
ncbi:hypothetical protein C3K47_15035 [Solitalea longa]|uniref:Uncharacterized protein n=1 Tax=Solitalea longa TaxID=2079460 RepID=A0A2S4ZYL6_9SPHI|nr:hypothetical protein [Solitalea longa]POY35376.1 hypothetical protein C3K47_15035 [Solitalea longa]